MLIDSNKKIEEITNRIEKLCNDLNVFLIEECKKNKYTISELYIGIRYLLARYEAVLGKETVKQIEKSFMITNTTKDHLC